MGYCKKNTFKNQLKEQIGEFIIVLIKSGVDCCRKKGVLCGIKEDFLVIMNDDSKMEISLKAIVAIKKSIGGTKQNNYFDEYCYK